MRAFTHLAPAHGSRAKSDSLSHFRPALSGERSIASADHPAERAADRAADHAMSARPGPVERASTPSFSARHTSVPPLVDRVLASSGALLDANIRASMEPRFGYDFSRIRIHTDSEAAESARSIRAQAYASGNHIAFGAGQYRPAHPEGANLLAHELAHTIQQGAEPAARTVFRRRIPDAPELQSELAGPDLSAHEEGLIRIIRGAWDELGLKYEQQAKGGTRDQSKRAQVLLEAEKIGIKVQSGGELFAVLEHATKKQLLQVVEIIRKVDPTVTLTDRAPGHAAADQAKVKDLLNEADKVYGAVASGARDSDLTAIFGATNVGTAKTKFAHAKTQIHALQSQNQIFTDPSQFGHETHIGGFSGGGGVTLGSDFIDKPHEPISVAVLVHESSHAGNPDVGDKGYLLSPGFDKMTEADKLDNAADFEVIAWRMLDPKNPKAYPGETFHPGAITQKDAVLREASEIYRRAWDAAGDLNNVYNFVFDNPEEWDKQDVSKIFSGVPAGSHFSQSVPFWSKVENMTIHKRTSINPKNHKPATNPVTQIDLAQSENVIRKLNAARKLMPYTAADAAKLEAKALPSQATRMSRGVQDEAKVLATLVRSQILNQEITGDVARDERAIEELDKAGQQKSFAYMLKPRDPASFP